jgi:hypothetical protein
LVVPVGDLGDLTTWRADSDAPIHVGDTLLNEDPRGQPLAAAIAGPRAMVRSIQMGGALASIPPPCRRFGWS